MKKKETEKFIVVCLKKILENKKNYYHQNIKCDCTHKQNDHYNGGWCKKCGCTWFYPNIKYIERKKEISK